MLDPQHLDWRSDVSGHDRHVTLVLDDETAFLTLPVRLLADVAARPLVALALNDDSLPRTQPEWTTLVADWLHPEGDPS